MLRNVDYARQGTSLRGRALMAIYMCKTCGCPDRVASENQELHELAANRHERYECVVCGSCACDSCFTGTQTCVRCGLMHAHGRKFCPACCSACGGEKDAEGNCANYCEGDHEHLRHRADKDQPREKGEVVMATIVNRDKLLSDIVWDLKVVDPKTRIGDITVKFFVPVSDKDFNEFSFNLEYALTCLSTDLFWDERGDWSDADRAAIFIEGRKVR